MRKQNFPLLCLLCLLLTACGTQSEPPVSEVAEVLPFDETIFTQGLEMQGENLLVSGGLYGESFAGIYSPAEERLLLRKDLDEAYFGEGMTLSGENVLQLTWREGVLFVRDKDTLEEVGRAQIQGEGWGIAAGDDTVYLSDGTDEIRRLDPLTLTEDDRFPVTDDGESVPMVNELEYANGKLYANIWQTDDIVRIDPETGLVEQRYNFSGLLSEEEQKTADVLNGIAHIDGDRFYITGKRWPKLFEVILR